MGKTMVSPNGIRTWYLYVPIVNTIVVDFSRLKLTVFCVFQFFFMDSQNTPAMLYVPVILASGGHTSCSSQKARQCGALRVVTNNGLTKLTTSQELRPSKAWGLDVQFSDQTGPWMKPNTCAVGHK